MDHLPPCFPHFQRPGGIRRLRGRAQLGPRGREVTITSRPVGAPQARRRKSHVGSENDDAETQQHTGEGKTANPERQRRWHEC